MGLAGRPKKLIDYDLFEKLCHIQCTENEIAFFFEMDVDTLCARIKERYGRTFQEVREIFGAAGKISIRRKQFQVAEAGNVQMLMHLGEQYLDQKRKWELDVSQNKPIQLKYALGDEPKEAIETTAREVKEISNDNNSTDKTT